MNSVATRWLRGNSIVKADTYRWAVMPSARHVSPVEGTVGMSQKREHVEQFLSPEKDRGLKMEKVKLRLRCAIST
jgi:hypothetical protein